VPECLRLRRYWRYSGRETESRFLVIISVLAIAGSLAAQQIVPRSVGTLPTDGGLFVCFLLGTIVIVGGLTYLPALALAPIIESLQLSAGMLF